MIPRNELEHHASHGDGELRSWDSMTSNTSPLRITCPGCEDKQSGGRDVIGSTFRTLGQWCCVLQLWHSWSVALGVACKSRWYRWLPCKVRAGETFSNVNLNLSWGVTSVFPLCVYVNVINFTGNLTMFNFRDEFKQYFLPAHFSLGTMQCFSLLI